MSPTQRTLAYLRNDAQFNFVQVVEKWICHAKKRVDLFDAIDIVAIDGQRIVGVQCTSASGHAGHRAKILGSERMRCWSRSGGLIWLITWSKRGPRNKRKTWQPRIEVIEFPS